ncbi:MAG: pro-sigmaK processing inhibitor BofA family protein [Methanospirillum sp.]|nr:pro-sigmaK processing inhibitor BofA family protein [Methanospirillum sp.]
MIVTIFLIIIGLIILAGLWFVLKNIVKLIINSVLGLVILGIVKVLNIFPLIGYPQIEIGWGSVLICALAGIPGAILVMILHLIGLA